MGLNEALLSIGVTLVMTLAVSSMTVRLSLYLRVYQHVWMKTTNVEKEHYYTVWFLFTLFFLFLVLLLPRYFGVSQLLSDVIMGSVAGLSMLFYPTEESRLIIYLIPGVTFILFLLQFSVEFRIVENIIKMIFLSF